MSAQRGKDLLLKIGDGDAPESFAAVGGLRARTLSLNAGTVDATHAGSEGGWRELLTGAGVRQASVSGAGVFLNDAAAEAVRAVAGPFQIANLDYAGDHDGEATMSLALESAGALAFTPEAV